MPTPFTLGAQNADTAFGAFVDGDVTFFTTSVTTAQTQSAVAHGLSAAPDFVLLSTDIVGGSTDGLAYSATATTLTIIVEDTEAGNATVSVFAANLS